MATNLTAAKTLIRGVRRQPRELKEELLKMLPKVGQGYTCPILIPGDVGSV